MHSLFSVLLLSILLSAFIPNVAKALMMLFTAHYHGLCAYIEEFKKAAKEENWK